MVKSLDHEAVWRAHNRPGIYAGRAMGHKLRGRDWWMLRVTQIAKRRVRAMGNKEVRWNAHQ